jgi:hypothetical protein
MYMWLTVAERTAVAIGVMASATFVVGTVVGYQYHSMIMKLASHPKWDDTHRSLVLRWFFAGTSSAS